MRLAGVDGGFDLWLGDRLILGHRADAPALFVGRGRPDVKMYRGNFDIEDRLDERVALRDCTVTGDTVTFGQLTMTARDGALHFANAAPGLNRFWLRVAAEPGEHMWGGGEQLSYFDLAGRRFPLWSSEPGVGRDKSTEITFLADRMHAGGDYFHTNYPQPTYLSSRRYALHLDSTAYAVFDFRDPAFHEIECWEIPARIELFQAADTVSLVSLLSIRFGRQPQLPDWAISGAILGLKDGAHSLARLDRIVEAGAVVTGLWCEDWVGLRETSFGKRLFWDWKANEARYPALRQKIAELNDRGIRFLGYVNPYIASDASMFADGVTGGYFARRPDSDEVYLVDFGEFECGVVDFTNPDAAAWFAESVIGRNMLDFGLSGWMADFGEYLPTDVRLFDGSDPMLMHNAWPALWAKVNADAVASRGKTGDAVFFMRAGGAGVQAHCPLLWAGDQSVDFSRHDGVGTVITAALSSGLIGNAYHHSDLGGYTSLFGNVRTPELLMRWSELSAFSPVMRSHEGNRPAENLQLDGDDEVLRHFVRMTRVHAALAPYVRALCEEAAATGLPLQRPLFLHFPDDPQTCAIQTQYLYGEDLLVAPVIEANRRRWTGYLPAGAGWRHLWTGDHFEGGREVSVDAPLGWPPVFYRDGGAWAGLFEGVARI